MNAHSKTGVDTNVVGGGEGDGHGGIGGGVNALQNPSTTSTSTTNLRVNLVRCPCLDEHPLSPPLSKGKHWPRPAGQWCEEF